MAGSSVPGPAALGPGQTTRHVIGGLTENDTTWIAVRSHDGWGNWSGFSNVARVITANIPPGPAPDLRVEAVMENGARLAWTAGGDDTTWGRALGHLVRAAPFPLQSDNVESAPRSWTAPARVPGGQGERFTADVPIGHWVVVQAVDSVGNLASISNVVKVEAVGAGALPDTGAAIARDAAVLYVPDWARRAGARTLAVKSVPARTPVEMYWEAGPRTEPRVREIHVIDVGGRRVASVPLRADPRGIAFWDGRDAGGRRAPAGLYFARFDDGVGIATARIVLLR
jgi:hypothetical protein